MTEPTPSPIAGRATSPATAAAAAALSRTLPGAFAPFGATGLVACRAGFGGYRIALDQPDHARALLLALSSGVNVLDTSANYTDGASEALIGQVLHELVTSGTARRDELIVVTKAGYMQGANLRLANERRAAGRPFPDVVEYMDGCWHCIHPEYLADQLARSLARLGLETIDAFLLHNPEYFLTHRAEANGGRLAPGDRAEYERRLRDAFAFLETQVAAGTIARYGVSSNTFVVPAGEAEHTSLTRCWELACEVSGGASAHHFRVVQMPGNLLETGFATCANQPAGETPAAFCERHGLALLLNRPLNAFGGHGGLVRLADVPPMGAADEAAWRSAMDAMVALEEELKGRVAATDEAAAEVRRLLRHGSFLRDHWRHIDGREHWKQVVEMQLVPMAQYGLSLLRRMAGAAANGGDHGRAPFAQRYLESLNDLLRLGFAWYSADAREAAGRRREALLAALAREGAALEGASLSQLAILPLLAQPGAPVVLVGMRQAAYVQDVMGCFRAPLATAGLPAASLARAHAALAAGV